MSLGIKETNTLNMPNTIVISRQCLVTSRRLLNIPKTFKAIAKMKMNKMKILYYASDSCPYAGHASWDSPSSFL